MLYAWYMFDMLTPMLYIFVWPKRWGATRGKGLAHVPIVEFKALDQVYRVCIAHGMFGKEIHECTPISMGHVDMSGESYLHAPDWGSKWGNCSQMVPIICILNQTRISWVSIEIYYHDNFVFGHIFMFLTSIFAHFCFLCTSLVSKQQKAYGESNHGMLFICWHMLRS